MDGKVYLIEGWFGDIEWVEAIYALKEDAEAKCSELRQTRRSEKSHVPDWVQGVCKFTVEEWEVL